MIIPPNRPRIPLGRPNMRIKSWRLQAMSDFH